MDMIALLTDGFQGKLQERDGEAILSVGLILW